MIAHQIMDVDFFKSELRSKTVETFVDTYVVNASCGVIIKEEDLDLIKTTFESRFKSLDCNVKAFVVGSAKFGFSYTKKIKEGVVKPAYRPYDPADSDIDVAIVSPKIYYSIWSELSREAFATGAFPFDGKLSAYMYHGWIRTDQIRNSGLYRSTWNSAMNSLNVSDNFKLKKLRCALYSTTDFLKQYHRYGIQKAKNIL